MTKPLSFCAAAACLLSACLLSACAGQPPAQAPGGVAAADDDYVPTGTHLPRKKSNAPAGVAVVDGSALDNGRNTHATPGGTGR
jgi:hypothetical protein